MNRSGFTLMEMLVSVVLIVLITLFMYGAIAGSKMTSKTLAGHAEVEQNRTRIYALFYQDLIEALWVKTVPTANRRFTVVQMQTRNTLYDISVPYVTYYVNTHKNSLIRLESARAISLPVGYDDRYRIHADILAEKVSDFNLYTGLNTEGNASEGGTASSASSASGASQKTVQPVAEKMDSKHFLLFLDAEKISTLLLELVI